MMPVLFKTVSPEFLSPEIERVWFYIYFHTIIINGFHLLSSYYVAACNKHFCLKRT